MYSFKNIHSTIHLTDNHFGLFLFIVLLLPFIIILLIVISIITLIMYSMYNMYSKFNSLQKLETILKQMYIKKKQIKYNHTLYNLHILSIQTLRISVQYFIDKKLNVEFSFHWRFNSIFLTTQIKEIKV